MFMRFYETLGFGFKGVDENSLPALISLALFTHHMPTRGLPNYNNAIDPNNLVEYFGVAKRPLWSYKYYLWSTGTRLIFTHTTVNIICKDSCVGLFN